MCNNDIFISAASIDSVGTTSHKCSLENKNILRNITSKSRPFHKCVLTKNWEPNIDISDKRME